MTPEQQKQLFDFINMIAEGVAAKLSEKFAATPPPAVPPPDHKQANPKVIEVLRTNEDGKRKVQLTTLPDLIAELNDRMKMQIVASEVLIQSIQDNTKVIKKAIAISKEAKNKDEED